MSRRGIRSYLPEVGRWTQLDPTRQDANLYLYAAGDPVNLVDLSGAHAERHLAEGAYWVASTVTCGAVSYGTGGLAGALCGSAAAYAENEWIDPALDGQYGTHDTDLFAYVDAAWTLYPRTCDHRSRP